MAVRPGRGAAAGFDYGKGITDGDGGRRRRTGFKDSAGGDGDGRKEDGGAGSVAERRARWDGDSASGSAEGQHHRQHMDDDTAQGAWLAEHQDALLDNYIMDDDTLLRDSETPAVATDWMAFVDKQVSQGCCSRIPSQPRDPRQTI